MYRANIYMQGDKYLQSVLHLDLKLVVHTLSVLYDYVCFVMFHPLLCV